MQKVEDGIESIERSCVYVNFFKSITKRTLTSSICFQCIIEDYSNLKEGTYYAMTRDVSGQEGTLKLYKTKEHHAFQFHGELRDLIPDDPEGDEVLFYIMYDQYEPVWSGDLLETNYGYSIEVPSENILHIGNKNLHEKNVLVVQFSYRHYVFSETPVCHIGYVTAADENALSNDFLSLYESGKFTDVVLQSRDRKKYRVHKFICRSRSLFFRIILNNLNGTDTFTLCTDVESRILEIVIRYMYSGKLEELLLEDLLKVFGVATAFGMASLKKPLIIAFREMVNVDNVRMVRQEATSHFMGGLLPLDNFSLEYDQDSDEN